MSQSRRMSAVESLTNLAFGNIVAFVLWMWAIPYVYGIQTGATRAIGIIVIFNVSSVIRAFIMRRTFEWIGRKQQ